MGGLEVAEVGAEPRAAQDVREVEQRAVRSRVALAEDLLELPLFLTNKCLMTSNLLCLTLITRWSLLILVFQMVNLMTPGASSLNIK